MDELFGWIEASSIGRTIAQSLMLTASLSAVHVLGFTLATGGALVANLSRLGLVFAQRPIPQTTGPAGRIMLLGLAISIVTGALLFSARAASAAANGIFQIKMLLLVAAVTFHFAAQRWADTRPRNGAKLAAAAGALSLTLWTALAVAACAFILLE